MKVYLSGFNSMYNLLKMYDYDNILVGGGTNTKIEAMNLYLSGEHSVKNGSMCKSWHDLHILESFWYARKNTAFPRLYATAGDFLLDSGAFTFMNNAKENVDFDKYLEEYAEFIVKYNVKLFFELDLDSVVGIKKTEQFRERLERLTGRRCIPVWHKGRGKQYFIDMCKEWDYVALGGIAIKEIPIKVFEQAFPWFINTAHENDCKIHGLGYTNQKGLHKYRFDSVDSKSWVSGNMGGSLFRFNSKGYVEVLKGKGRLLAREGAYNNFIEWVKFSKYAEVNL